MTSGSGGGVMGGDRYRLRPVRDARARDEQRASGELADAVGDAGATSARIANAAARVDAARAAVASAVDVRARMAEATAIVRAERFADRQRRALAEALLEHAHARDAHARRIGAVDDARARLGIARAERELIERHFERWRDAQRKAAERRED